MTEVPKSSDFNIFALNGLTFWANMGRQSFDATAFFKTAARTNLEMASFAGKRARAYLELQSALLRCRTPQDATAVSLAFAQNTARDYIEASRRLGDSWRSGFHAPSPGTGPESLRRDYLSLGDTAPREAARDTERTAGPVESRRAA